CPGERLVIESYRCGAVSPRARRDGPVSSIPEPTKLVPRCCCDRSRTGILQPPRARAGRDCFMSSRAVVLLGLGVVIVLGPAVALWFARPQKSAGTVEVYGTSGLAIQGKGEVDGHSQELTGTVPTKFVLEGTRVTYTLTTTADSGEFRVRGIINDKPYG